MDLFKELGEALKPEPVMTITAFVGTKKHQHDFIVGASKALIETFLINTYGEQCWSWE